MSAATDPTERAILGLLAERGAGKTICPSEAARRLDPDGWAARMPDVRAAVARLHAAKLVVVTQRGEAVDPAEAKGPIRVGMIEGS